MHGDDVVAVQAALDQPFGRRRAPLLADTLLGQRSRLTLSLDLEPHGIGKVLVPLVVKPLVRKEIPRDEAHLKELLEAGTA
ncbi:hypothetical protein [Streptomyces violaceus]|uniref:hypothetical protein n=1 Tax=Streptomyces violaceus TaxID=1936 RepID=UPI0031E5A0CC